MQVYSLDSVVEGRFERFPSSLTSWRQNCGWRRKTPTRPFLRSTSEDSFGRPLGFLTGSEERTHRQPYPGPCIIHESCVIDGTDNSQTPLF